MNNEDALYTKNKLDETLTKFNMVVNEQKKLRDNMQKEFERSQQLEKDEQEFEEQIKKYENFLINYQAGDKFKKEVNLLDLESDQSKQQINFKTKFYKQEQDIMILKNEKMKNQLNETMKSVKNYQRRNKKYKQKHKTCINCKESFIESLNNHLKEQCLYHWGSIKFFSCRSCGADDYYNCCLKCGKCSIGCRKYKHFSE